jgi:UDP-2,3-diacylglucosamine hydrolase
MAIGNNTYFASDFHLGSMADKADHKREKKIVRWLESIEHDAAKIYLLGDVFDFWFEYKHVVPKGHVRLLGKLAELSDRGVELHIFTGNHDVWMFDYLACELGAKVYYNPIEIEEFGLKLLIGHGDGLGPGDEGFKFIKKIFTNKLAQRCFAFLHPYIGVSLAQFFSRKSRETTGDKDSIYMGDDKEFLVQFCLDNLRKRHYDCFVFGHRHMLIDKVLPGNSRYINLGEWFTTCNFAKLSSAGLELKAFQG